MSGNVSTTKGRCGFSDLKTPRRIFAIVVLALVAAEPACAQSASKVDGEAIYRERCVGCHEGGVARAPDLATLRQLSPERVLTALRSGSMSTQGQGLNAE